MNTKLPAAQRFALLGLAFLLTLACGFFPRDPKPTETGLPSTPTSLFPRSTSTATSAPSDTPTAASTPLTLGTNVKDIIYCTMDSIPLRMDVYYPQTGNGNWPVVMYVHGGGWTKGDKSDIIGSDNLSMLTSAGYMVVSVNYRLAPEFRFPAMIEDVKCAIRFLRAHAKDFDLDPQHIAAWGVSAGGHLVSLLGLADESAGWDVGEYLDQSSRVQAVVDMFGPTDLTKLDMRNHLAERLLGVDPVPEDMLVAASPVNYITPDDPPFLILHGDRDFTVDISQSEILYQALISAGVRAQFVVVRNASHGFRPFGGAIIPSQEEIARIMLDFLDQFLKP